MNRSIMLSSGALLVVNSDGRFVYDPNGKFDGLNIGESSSDRFTYDVSDGQGHVSTATVTISISGAVNGLYVVGGGGILSGSAADDQIACGSGNDFVAGGAGYDWLQGGGGNDTLIGGYGSDGLDGGDGGDFAFGGDFAADGSFVVNSGNDNINGDAGDDGLWGMDGDDVLSGGDGSDGLVGGAGNDMLTGGGGADFLFGGDFTSTGTFAANSGNDVLNGGDGADGLWGFDGDDAINGDAGNDVVFGGAGADVIEGGTDNDYLLGEAGDDQVAGGAGFDYLYGGAGADTFICRKGDSADWILDFSAAQGDKLRFLNFGYANFAAIALVDLSSPGSPAVQLTFIEGSNVDQLTIFGVTLAQLNAGNVLIA